MVPKKLKTTKQERNELERRAIKKEIDRLLHQINPLKEKVRKLLIRYNQLNP